MNIIVQEFSIRRQLLLANMGEGIAIIPTTPELIRNRDSPVSYTHLDVYKRQIERLAQAGFKEIIINHAHLGQQIEDALGDGKTWGVSIQYSPEKVALETAGGVANALHLLGDEPFLVVNGDTFTDINFQTTALQATIHADRSGTKNPRAHLVLVNNPPQHPKGDFAIENGLLKNTGETMLTFSGVGVYHPDLFASITRGEPAKLAPLLRQAIAENQATAEHHQGVWHDIGTPERLKSLDKSLLKS